MDIDTKYNIEDIGWYIHQGSIKGSEIYKIKAEYLDIGKGIYDVIVTYTLGSYDFREPNVYSTKEEAGVAWLKQQGLDCGLKDSL